MDSFEILKYPHPKLSLISENVIIFDNKLRSFANKLVNTFKINKCIGLSAPQVGNNIRVIVVDTLFDEDIRIITRQPSYIVMVNPEIVESSEEIYDYNEGCFSLPLVYEKVTRPKVIKVVYQTTFGETKEITASSLLSTCIQHEIDHLDGKMFFDRVSNLRKTRVLKKYKLQQKTNYANIIKVKCNDS